MNHEEEQRLLKLLEKQGLELQSLRSEMREVAYLLRLIAKRLGPPATYPQPTAIAVSIK